MRASLVSLSTLSTLSVTAQRIFINQVPAYSQLPPCAAHDRGIRWKCSVQTPPARLSPTVSRTQLVPIPSAT
ncbi:hypothetical protein B0T21DRAFT_411963 [Apiosordaria backusii]|uniref:Secreted protein n=1 Tax=Apiosordaria backusii TaxID=314023 RepID=A0AA40BJF8_9PEZI|nr:hypothetical protein B0T21DRAFT_411963 [Apiosordaria backusii]